MSRSRSKPERTPMTSAACCITKEQGASLAVVVNLIFTPTFYRTGGALSVHHYCGCGEAASGSFVSIRGCTQRLVPIFPNRFESLAAKDSGDFGGGTFVTDLKLSGGELVFAVLILRRDDAATHGKMQMFAA